MIPNRLLVDSGAATKSMGYDNHSLRLGGGRSGRFFQGLIDEAAIYNRALSRTETAAIYNAGPEGKL